MYLSSLPISRRFVRNTPDQGGEGGHQPRRVIFCHRSDFVKGRHHEACHLCRSSFVSVVHSYSLAFWICIGALGFRCRKRPDGFAIRGDPCVMRIGIVVRDDFGRLTDTHVRIAGYHDEAGCHGPLFLEFMSIVFRVFGLSPTIRLGPVETQKHKRPPVALRT